MNQKVKNNNSSKSMVFGRMSQTKFIALYALVDVRASESVLRRKFRVNFMRQ